MGIYLHAGHEIPGRVWGVEGSGEGGGGECLMDYMDYGQWFGSLEILVSYFCVESCFRSVFGDEKTIFISIDGWSLFMKPEFIYFRFTQSEKLISLFLNS